MANTKITYNRGTTHTIGVNYSNTNGVNGATVLFTVKTTPDTDVADATALVKKTLALVANSATIEITPTDIADTWDSGNYVYDIKVIDANGKIYLAQEGVFTLKTTATNRTA